MIICKIIDSNAPSKKSPLLTEGPSTFLEMPLTIHETIELMKNLLLYYRDVTGQLHLNTRDWAHFLCKYFNAIDVTGRLRHFNSILTAPHSRDDIYTKISTFTSLYAETYQIDVAVLSAIVMKKEEWSIALEEKQRLRLEMLLMVKKNIFLEYPIAESTYTIETALRQIGFKPVVLQYLSDKGVVLGEKDRELWYVHQFECNQFGFVRLIMGNIRNARFMNGFPPQRIYPDAIATDS